MRSILTTLALAAGMTLMAQDADTDNDKKTPEERAKQRTEQMTKELGLNAEQIAKVYTINMNFANAMSDVKKIEDADTRKGRADALKNKRDADLKGVLTAEQFSTMVALREKKKAEQKEKKESKETHTE